MTNEEIHNQELRRRVIMPISLPNKPIGKSQRLKGTKSFILRLQS